MTTIGEQPNHRRVRAFVLSGGARGALQAGYERMQDYSRAHLKLAAGRMPAGRPDYEPAA